MLLLFFLTNDSAYAAAVGTDLVDSAVLGTCTGLLTGSARDASFESAGATGVVESFFSLLVLERLERLIFFYKTYKCTRYCFKKL